MQVRSQTAPHPDLFPSIARRGLGTQPQRARRARRKRGYWEEHVLRRGQGERRGGWEPRPSTPLWVPVFTGTTTISVRAAPSADGERADTWVRPYQINRAGRGSHPRPSQDGERADTWVRPYQTNRGRRGGHPHPSHTGSGRTLGSAPTRLTEGDEEDHPHPSQDGERADTWVRPYQINRGGRGDHPYPSPLPSRERGSFDEIRTCLTPALRPCG